MSMPEFPKPDPDLTQDQALTMILSSIALEEAALSHIINAEGEKIQHVLKQTPCGQHPADLNSVLAINQSVANLLEIVLQNQMILKNKMDKVLVYLPKPPCPPEPPCPPAEHCSFDNACFDVISKTYQCDEPLQWKENNVCDHFALVPNDCTKIQLPRTGSLTIGLCIDNSNSRNSCIKLELIIFCQDKNQICKIIHSNPCHDPTVLYRELTVQMPCSCSPCYASVIVRAPCETHVRQGRITFTKI